MDTIRMIALGTVLKVKSAFLCLVGLVNKMPLKIKIVFVFIIGMAVGGICQ